MNPRIQVPPKQIALLLLSLVIALVVVAGISYKVFSLDLSMSPGAMIDTIKGVGNYQGVLLVNLLVGVSIILFIVELRWDALRVTLTVVVALIFGYLMTAVFNLDAANRFIRGEFRVKLVTEAVSPVDFGYGDKLSAVLNDPDDDPPLADMTVRFAGRAGDVVTILAFAEDAEIGIDLRAALFDPDGGLLAEGEDATPEQLDTYRRDLESAADAVIEDVILPEDGLYTITARPTEATASLSGEITVRLLSDADPVTDFVYGEQRGADFNRPNVKNPVTEASYRFAGHAGDEVTILAFAARPNIDVNVQIALLDPDGGTLAANRDASPAQLQTYRRDLKSERDAVIERITLPADGVYTVHVQPEAISRSLKFSETMDKTQFAYKAFLLGPLNRLNRWVDWIRDAITLIMLGLAIAIVFRANQFSLGAEGQLYFGALVSGMVVLYFGNVPRTFLVPIALLSAATAGFLWGLLPGALKAYLGANELVSTLMLNTIATRFYELVLTEQLKPPDAGYTSSDWFPKSGLLAPIVDVGGVQITIAVFILIALVLLTWLLIQRTPIGYEIRMIGSNIKFADYGGVNTRRTIMLAMAISGIVAGLAGAHLAMGVHRKLILNISLGLAFQGVVVALLARNNPLVVVFTGLLYAYLRTGARFMESDANISSEVVNIIQAVIILLITAEALVTVFRHRRIRRRGSVDLDMNAGANGGTTPTTPAEEGAHV